MLWAHRNEALNGPNGPAGMPLRIVLHPYDLGGSWGIHRTLTEADVPTNDWHRIITAPFLATSAAYKFGFETHYAGGLPNFSQRTWLLDLVQMEEITGADVEAFLAKLKPIIEAVDVNVGKVYTEEKFWQSAKVLEENGVLQLDVPGLFDDPTRLGQNVTRFWLMQPEITTLPLTNGSDEWRARVRLIGFYQWEKGDTQAAALRHAATEILGALSRKTTEFGDLCTGPNYMGYLADRPRWATPVEAGEIKGIGLKGHLVQIDVVFHEEVPH
jgi:hypothetical protein